MNISKNGAAPPIKACQRCGTCCEKGGPAFHGCDRPILESGRIALANVYTIRKDEPVFDNVAGHLDTAPEDILKIRSANEVSACTFFRRADRSCAVYADRPLECRILECWNPESMIAAYRKERLGRKDLLAGVPELWEMVTAHEQECAYATLSQMVKANQWEGLAYRVRYDFQVRHLMVEKGKMDPGMLDFLFGMPLTVTLRRYGLSQRQIKALAAGETA